MKYQGGNALFLILIAVALFAALSYAITSSGRGGGNITKENYSIAAARLVQYFGAMQYAIQKMQLINGCSDEELSFEWEPFDGTEAALDNPITGDKFECFVYHPDGGAAARMKNDDLFGSFPPQFFVYGVADIEGIGDYNNGTDSVDLYFLFELPSDIDRQQFCEMYNDKLGITAMPTSHLSGNPRFKGTYGPAQLINHAGIAGVYSACYNYTYDTTRYLIYYVLKAR